MRQPKNSGAESQRRAYRDLKAAFRKVLVIGDVKEQLQWEQSVRLGSGNEKAKAILPSGAADVRSAQLGVLGSLEHSLVAHDSIKRKLDAVGDGQHLSPLERRDTVLMRKRYHLATATPPDLTEKLEAQTSKTWQIWTRARPENDFKSLAPHLQTVFDLKCEQAEAIGAAVGKAPYDALVSEFQPGLSDATIEREFAFLQKHLPSLVTRIVEKQRSEPGNNLNAEFGLKIQRALVDRLAAATGLDETHGRLDEAAHPFSSGRPGDVRLTTAYEVGNLVAFLNKAFLSAAHEIGHALYTQGLRIETADQLVGREDGMGTHESQSLFWERHIGRTEAFYRWVRTQIELVTNDKNVLAEATPENMFRASTRVQPSLIRTDADEVTYPMHVVLRWELERALIQNKIKVLDLPEAWREGMKNLVGIAPETDRDGVMQDTHWPEGYVGYFPSYAIGAIWSAQLKVSMEKEIGSIDSMVERGEFKPVLGWLRTHIHEKGAMQDGPDLMKDVTGSELDAPGFIADLENRYL